MSESEQRGRGSDDGLDRDARQVQGSGEDSGGSPRPDAMSGP